MERIIIVEDSGNEELIAGFLSKMKGKVKLDSDFEKLVGKTFSFGDISQADNRNKKIAVRFPEGVNIIKAEQVIKIESSEAGALIYTLDGNLIKASEGIETLALKFNLPAFVRVQEHLLINLDFVKKIHFGEKMTLRIVGGAMVPVHDDMQDSILKYFEKYSQ
nr:hypothetical protein [Bacteroidota bacterium]